MIGKQLTASLAAKPPPPAQLEHQCRDYAPNHLRSDGRIFRPRNQVARAVLSASRTSDSEKLHDPSLHLEANRVELTRLDSVHRNASYRRQSPCKVDWEQNSGF